MVHAYVLVHNVYLCVLCVEDKVTLLSYVNRFKATTERIKNSTVTSHTGDRYHPHLIGAVLPCCPSYNSQLLYVNCLLVSYYHDVIIDFAGHTIEGHKIYNLI